VDELSPRAYSVAVRVTLKFHLHIKLMPFHHPAKKQSGTRDKSVFKLTHHTQSMTVGIVLVTNLRSSRTCTAKLIPKPIPVTS